MRRTDSGLNCCAGTLCLFGLLIMLGLILVPRTCHAQRRYWTVSLDSLALGHVKHTHVETRGQVVYVRTQDDGDVHIRIVTPLGNPALFVICECTPKEPCARPRVGADIIVRGITRRDPEHGWWEIHPVESWTYATAGE